MACNSKLDYLPGPEVFEAASNAIRHAHHGDPKLLIHIQCALLGDAIEVSLLDQGAPFDVEAVPHLDPTEFRIGGRGVFLMRALLDELGCQPRSCGGNALRMVKRGNASA